MKTKDLNPDDCQDDGRLASPIVRVERPGLEALTRTITPDDARACVPASGCAVAGAGVGTSIGTERQKKEGRGKPPPTAAAVAAKAGELIDLASEIGAAVTAAEDVDGRTLRYALRDMEKAQCWLVSARAKVRSAVADDVAAAETA